MAIESHLLDGGFSRRGYCLCNECGEPRLVSLRGAQTGDDAKQLKCAHCQKITPHYLTFGVKGEAHEEVTISLTLSPRSEYERRAALFLDALTAYGVDVYESERLHDSVEFDRKQGDAWISVRIPACSSDWEHLVILREVWGMIPWLNDRSIWRTKGKDVEHTALKLSQRALDAIAHPKQNN